MRPVLPALFALAALAGCADQVAEQKSGTILQYSAKDIDAATKQANDECAAYHQTAKLQQTDNRPGGAVATFACE
jgi:hypothetical protein